MVIRCKSCKEKIKAGATKCPKCQSFQNWQRYLILGNTTLALLVALVSIVTLGGPPLINAIRDALPRSEDIIVQSLAETSGVTAGNIQIVAYNRGTADGIVEPAARLVLEAGEDRTVTGATIHGSDDSQIVKPETKRVFSVEPDDEDVRRRLWNGEFDSCKIKYNVSELGSGTGGNVVTFPCPTSNKLTDANS